MPICFCTLHCISRTACMLGMVNLLKKHIYRKNKNVICLPTLVWFPSLTALMTCKQAGVRSGNEQLGEKINCGAVFATHRVLVSWAVKVVWECCSRTAGLITSLMQQKGALFTCFNCSFCMLCGDHFISQWVSLADLTDRKLFPFCYYHFIELVTVVVLVF